MQRIKELLKQPPIMAENMADWPKALRHAFNLLDQVSKMPIYSHRINDGFVYRNERSNTLFKQKKPLFNSKKKLVKTKNNLFV